jgi:pimeloyl-ACP methyl ester carboxylesterase
LPGTLCTGAIFDRQIKALQTFAPSVEVVQFRHENSIEEMAETVLERIPQSGEAAVAGFSMGGMVAMALAREYPERVAKLALLNSNSHADLNDRQASRTSELAEARETSISRVMEKHFLPRYLYLQNTEHQKLIIAMANELGLECFEAQVEALATRSDSKSSLEMLDCPTLVLGSREDILCPPQEQIDMHSKIRHGDLVLLGGCGHFSTLERPEAVSSSLCNWYLERDQRS